MTDILAGGNALDNTPKKDACIVCEKTVYSMDKVAADDKVFHKSCLRCGHCNKILSLGNYAALNGLMYCKPHFKQLFALKGNYSDGFKASEQKNSRQGSETQQKEYSNSTSFNPGQFAGMKPSNYTTSNSASPRQLQSTTTTAAETIPPSLNGGSLISRINALEKASEASSAPANIDSKISSSIADRLNAFELNHNVSKKNSESSVFAKLKDEEVERLTADLDFANRKIIDLQKLLEEKVMLIEKLAESPKTNNDEL